jgi:hypothetical protein
MNHGQVMGIKLNSAVYGSNPVPKFDLWMFNFGRKVIIMVYVATPSVVQTDVEW